MLNVHKGKKTKTLIIQTVFTLQKGVKNKRIQHLFTSTVYEGLLIALKMNRMYNFMEDQQLLYHDMFRAMLKLGYRLQIKLLIALQMAS